MQVTLYADFPYSRQSTSLDVTGEINGDRLTVTAVKGESIIPTTIKASCRQLSGYKPEYPAPWVADINIDTLQSLRKLAGLPKDTIQNFGVGTPFWAS
jgi:hypothetical protein